VPPPDHRGHKLGSFLQPSPKSHHTSTAITESQAQEHAQAQAEPQRRASEGPEPPSEGEGAWGDSWTEGMREGKKHASEQIDEVDYAWEQFARSHTHDHL